MKSCTPKFTPTLVFRNPPTPRYEGSPACCGSWVSWLFCSITGHPRNLDSAEKSGVDEQHFWDCCGLLRLGLQGGLGEGKK